MSTLLFDGTVYKDKSYHYSIMYVNCSKEIIEGFVSDMKKTYHVNPPSFETTNSQSNTYFWVKYFSKTRYENLLSYFNASSTSDENCSIPTEIFNKKEQYKILLLRAFWENEGSISISGKLSADLKNYKVLTQLSKMHKDFGLKHYISRYWKGGRAYKLCLNKSEENYGKFIDLQLSSKSIFTKGYNKGRKKIDVLNEYFNKRFF